MGIDDKNHVRSKIRDDLYKMEVFYKENGELVFLDKIKTFFKKESIEFQKFPDLKYLPQFSFYSFSTIKFFFSFLFHQLIMHPYIYGTLIGLSFTFIYNFSFFISLIY